MPLGAAIGGGGVLASLIGSGAQVYEQGKAISAQQNMLTAGLGAAGGYFNTAQNILNPYVNMGSNALQTYISALPNLTKPFNPSDLAATPGYAFTLGQGQKATIDALGPSGQIGSGNEGKALASFSTGLAQNTYNQQFQNYLAQNQQIANLLYQPVPAGIQAGTTLAGISGQIGQSALGANVTTGGGIAGSTTGTGNAIAGGATGTSNALTSGIQYSILAPYLAALTAKAQGGASPVVPTINNAVPYSGGPEVSSGAANALYGL
jgi:hypothetical protein